MYTHGFVENVMGGLELVLTSVRKNAIIMKFLQAAHGSSASLLFGTLIETGCLVGVSLLRLAAVLVQQTWVIEFTKKSAKDKLCKSNLSEVSLKALAKIKKL